MSAANLTTPQVITNTVTTVKVTGLVNDTERECIEIHYITSLSDGTPFQRGNISINGYDAVKVAYTEMTALFAAGKTFEEVSREFLYAKVLAGLAG